MARKKIKQAEKEEKIKIKKQEMQIKLAVLFMLIAILVVFIFYFIVQGISKFSYAGVKFQKTKQGNLVLYLAKFPFAELTGNVIGDLSIYFRADPRELENIPIEGDILLKNNVALAVNSDELKCSDKVLAGTTLAQFLGRLGASSFGATTSKEEVLELNRTYVDCEDTSKYSVVMFKEGEINKIEKTGEDCYVLSVANCEIMNVTERFMIGVWAGAARIEL